ncbi:MAG: enoyl-CoA hydratase/isomerase family protein [Ectothiorhodospiraceae bacterium]|nr:enoyl-CoA hydratase/isomerase family protein [Ectothiorhodospiraceae bacterium]MCH8503252.1 enoyl-CoA hydratase/isomerase family protein [Ectothiorhodospiraceae bacterium]
MSGELVRVEVKSSVAWLVLNSPENMNALSRGLLEQIERAFIRFEADADVRCVVITGSGRAFSAGGDLLGFREDLTEHGVETLIERLDYAQRIFNRIEALPKPVIAAVNGYAIAGGLELLLCCDIVIAAASARIGDGHARYGIIPAGGATARLPRKIAPNRANLMFYSADYFPAETLEAWGLVNQVVPDEQLLEATATHAERIARHSPLGLAHVKRILGGGGRQTPAEDAKAEIEAFRQYAESNDLAEGLAAFGEKQKPTFTGQ